MRNSILASLAAALALLAVSHVANPAAQGRGRGGAEGFVSEGVPKMPNPPGPAPKRDLSGAWVGPQANRPEPVPPMTAAGQAAFKERKGYGPASGNFGRGQAAERPGEANDPFITCDPLGFPRNLLAHAISSRGGMLFGSAPNRILIAYEQQRVWREIFTDGRALPKAVDVKGAPESRYYGYSVGHWESDNTLVIETTGVDERVWVDEAGHPLSSSAHITERYVRPDEYNLQVTVTVDDPKYYTKPFATMKANFYWMKAQEFSESFCVPSEAIEYRDSLARPSGIQIK
jgi:hypothetical protein